MFLEQPKDSDVLHNALVSVVLNCLGQYTGIAFLTSSRGMSYALPWDLATMLMSSC